MHKWSFTVWGKRPKPLCRSFRDNWPRIVRFYPCWLQVKSKVLTTSEIVALLKCQLNFRFFDSQSGMFFGQCYIMLNVLAPYLSSAVLILWWVGLIWPECPSITDLKSESTREIRYDNWHNHPTGLSVLFYRHWLGPSMFHGFSLHHSLLFLSMLSKLHWNKTLTRLSSVKQILVWQSAFLRVACLACTVVNPETLLFNECVSFSVSIIFPSGHHSSLLYWLHWVPRLVSLDMYEE